MLCSALPFFLLGSALLPPRICPPAGGAFTAPPGGPTQWSCHDRGTGESAELRSSVIYKPTQSKGLEVDLSVIR